MKRWKYFLIGVIFFVLVVAASYVIPTDPLPINTTACVLPGLFCIIPIGCFTLGFLNLNGPKGFQEWMWEIAQYQYKRANMELTHETWDQRRIAGGWLAIVFGTIWTIISLIMLAGMRR